jgi:hypothetical protein
MKRTLEHAVLILLNEDVSGQSLCDARGSAATLCFVAQGHAVYAGICATSRAGEYFTQILTVAA